MEGYSCMVLNIPEMEFVRNVQFFLSIVFIEHIVRKSDMKRYLNRKKKNKKNTWVKDIPYKL